MQMPRVGPFSLHVARPYSFLDVGLDSQANCQTQYHPELPFANPDPEQPWGSCAPPSSSLCLGSSHLTVWPLFFSECVMNLDDFISMDPCVGVGNVFSLPEFIQHFTENLWPWSACLLNSTWISLILKSFILWYAMPLLAEWLARWINCYLAHSDQPTKCGANPCPTYWVIPHRQTMTRTGRKHQRRSPAFNKPATFVLQQVFGLQPPCTTFFFHDIMARLIQWRNVFIQND